MSRFRGSMLDSPRLLIARAEETAPGGRQRRSANGDAIILVVPLSGNQVDNRASSW